MNRPSLATLDRLLECAVVVSWEDLLPPGITGSIKSAKLTRDLHLIMYRQNEFQPATNHGRDGLLQVAAPTQLKTEEAGAALTALHLQLESTTAQARRMVFLDTQLPA
jgi:hypothetical protein